MYRSRTKRVAALVTLTLQMIHGDAGAQRRRRRPVPTVTTQEALCELWQGRALEEVIALRQEAQQAMGECNRCTASHASTDAHHCPQLYRDDLISYLHRATAIHESLRDSQGSCQISELWDLQHQAVQIHRRVGDALQAARVCDFHWYQPSSSDQTEEPPRGGQDEPSTRAPTWLGVGLYGVLPGFTGPSKGAIGLDVVALRAMTNPASRPRFDLGLRGELGLTLDNYGWRLGSHDGALRLVAGLEGRLMFGEGNEGLALAATVAYSGLFPGILSYAPPTATSGHGVVLRGGGEYYIGSFGLVLNGEVWVGSSTVGEDYYTRYGIGLGVVVQTEL